MAILKSPVFIICCTLFILHQVGRIFYTDTIPFVDPYLDSLLAMPIILTLLLFERRYLFKWKDYYRLNKLEIGMATLLIIFISEVVFPYFSEEFTADWLDVILFILGAVLYYLTINPGKPEHSK